jgi:hypothetical protein
MGLLQESLENIDQNIKKLTKTKKNREKRKEKIMIKLPFFILFTPFLR